MAPGEVSDVTQKALKGLEHPLIKGDKQRLHEFNERTQRLNRK
jgi:hypothetical protein